MRASACFFPALVRLLGTSMSHRSDSSFRIRPGWTPVVLLCLSATLWDAGCGGYAQSNSGGNNPPPSLSLSGVASSGTTSNTAKITWTTNVPANSQVDYGTSTSYGQSSPLDSSMVTSHSVSLSGLSASTLYHYRVKSTDAYSNQATSADYTFTTSAASAPPTISAVAASNVTASGAMITWTTNVAANSQVDYGTTTNYGQSSPLDSSMATSHSVSLSGLSASTLYHYRANSADTNGNQATSSDFTFTTTAPPNPGSLSVSISAPVPGATVSGTVTITASAPDSVPITGVQFQVDGANVGPVIRATTYSLFWDTSTTSNGSHNLTAVASDAAGNRATSTAVAVTVLNNSSSVVQVSPANSWCSVINGVAPGTTVVLAPGAYTTPCTITASGTAAAPITIRSQGSSASSRAAFTYAGTTSNILDSAGSYLAIRWLSLGPSNDGVDGIKIRGGHDAVIEENLFQGIGGVGVPNNDVDTQRMTVRNNVFTNGKSTVIYFGCHDGTACHATEALIEGNLISGALPGDGVGSGVQIKLNSTATVRDNTIYNTTGAGIIIYGSNRGDPASIVEGNYVEGALNDAGINLSGGAAIARNNVVVGNGFYGIWAQDYNGRNLQQNVWIVENTVLNNQAGGIAVQNWQSGRGNVLAFNAIALLSGTSALNPSSPPGTVTGNTTCSPATSCFHQPTTAPYDLWPVSGGPLIGAAGNGSEAWRPFDDFMGLLRGTSADAGAFQRVGTGSGPLVGGGTPRPPRQ